MTPSLKPTRTTPDQQFLTRLQLAVDLRRQGYYDMARQVAMELGQSRPEESAVWHTLGQIWTDLGEFDMALQCCEESYRLLKLHGAVTTHASQFQSVALALAQARMRYGRFAGALDLWEAGRFNVSWSPWPGSVYWDNLNNPANRNNELLVQCEGGYGDFFMFMRWLPLLKRDLRVAKLGVCIWPSLIDFCDWKALGVDEIYQLGVDKIPFGKWQHATSIMSMPAVFGVQSWSDIPPATLPSGAPHQETIWRLDETITPADETEARKIRQVLRGSDTFRLGFCWRAEENSSPVRTKSLPVEVAEFIVYHTVTPDKANVDLFSLCPQRADLYNQDEFREPSGLLVEPDRMTSWRATAEYICSMDFVLTVDTAVAHLCGLLGVPTLVLLPRSSCWRWGIARQPGPPWYGEQLTYYHQPVALEWDGKAIVQALMERINAE